MRERTPGFTLLELMIVVVIIAILSAAAVPSLWRSKLTANETVTVSTLQAIARAQMMVMSSNTIDLNHDGRGEYVYLAELAGAADLRGGGGGTPPGGGPAKGSSDDGGGASGGSSSAPAESVGTSTGAPKTKAEMKAEAAAERTAAAEARKAEKAAAKAAKQGKSL